MKIKIINIFALSVLSLAVIGLIGYSFAAHHALEDYRAGETLEREAIFEGVADSVEKLNCGVIKICASNDPDKICELLAELWKNSAETTAQIDRLELEQADKLKLESFVNVAGDYAHMLEQKLQLVGEVSAEDREQLREISGSLEELREILRHAREENPAELNEFITEAQQEFPGIRYEGAFSESTRTRAPKGLLSYYVTEQKALKTAEAFAECALNPVAHTDGEVLPFYNFETEDGSVRVSVTKQGGAILYYKKDVETDGLFILPEQEKCSAMERTAEEFLERRGYGTVTVRWKSYYNGMAVLEMIPETEEGILLYPDRIKIWIDVQSGTVMGMDTRNYLMNHTERSFGERTLTIEEAEKNLSESLYVRERRMAILSFQDGSESFCYEFLCDQADHEILVYLDAETGKERDIRMVLRENNSELTL